jgi:hypothetical protein
MTAFAQLLSERSQRADDGLRWLSPTAAENLQTADIELALA